MRKFQQTKKHLKSALAVVLTLCMVLFMWVPTVSAATTAAGAAEAEYANAYERILAEDGFIYGVNMPWYKYLHNIFGSYVNSDGETVLPTFDKNVITNVVKNCKAMGVNSINFWLFTYYGGIKTDEAGNILGFDEYFEDNLRSTLQICEDYGMTVCLTSYVHSVESVSRQTVEWGNKVLQPVVNPTVRAQYFEKIVDPLCAIIKEYKDTVAMVDVYREPEGQILDVTNRAWGTDWETNLSFVAESANRFKSNLKDIPITAAGGWGTELSKYNDLGLDVIGTDVYTSNGSVYDPKEQNADLPVVAMEFGHDSGDTEISVAAKNTHMTNFLKNAADAGYQGAYYFTYNGSSQGTLSLTNNDKDVNDLAPVCATLAHVIAENKAKFRGETYGSDTVDAPIILQTNNMFILKWIGSRNAESYLIQGSTTGNEEDWENVVEEEFTAATADANGDYMCSYRLDSIPEGQTYYYRVIARGNEETAVSEPVRFDIPWITCKSSDNLIANNSFESGAAGWRVIDSQNNHLDLSADAVVSGDAFDGSKHLRLVGTNTTTGFVTQYIPVEKNAEYVYTMFYRVPDSYNTEVPQSVFKIINNGWSTSYTGDIYYTVSDGWVQYTTTFKTVDEALMLCFMDGNSPQIDIDSVYLFKKPSGGFTTVNKNQKNIITGENPVDVFEGITLPTNTETAAKITNYCASKPYENSGNLIANGDFETTPADNTAWNVDTFAKSGAMTVDGTVAYSGSKSLKFTADADGEVSYITVSGLSKNTAYNFGAYVNGGYLDNDNIGSVRFGLVGSDGFVDFASNADTAASNVPYSTACARDNKWHRRAFTFNTGNSTTVTFAVAGYSATMWFDDIMIAKASSCSATDSAAAPVAPALTGTEVTKQSCAPENNVLPEISEANASFWNDASIARKAVEVKVDPRNHDNEVLAYGKGLSVTNSTYAKKLTLNKNTYYTFTGFYRTETTGSAKFGFKYFDKDRNEQTKLVTVDPSTADYKWHFHSVQFMTNDYTDVYFFIEDNGGKLYLDDLKLYKSECGIERNITNATYNLNVALNASDNYSDNLITNGTFDTDLAGWKSNGGTDLSVPGNGVAAWSNGMMQIAASKNAVQNITVQPNTWYEFKFDVYRDAAGTGYAPILVHGNDTNTDITAKRFDTPGFAYTHNTEYFYSGKNTSVKIGFLDPNTGTIPAARICVDNVSVTKKKVTELVTNGTFDYDLSGWKTYVGSALPISGKIEYSSTIGNGSAMVAGANGGTLAQRIPVKKNTWYYFGFSSYQATGLQDKDITYLILGGKSATFTGETTPVLASGNLVMGNMKYGTKSFAFNSGDNPYVEIRFNPNGTRYVDDVSMFEISDLPNGDFESSDLYFWSGLEGITKYSDSSTNYAYTEAAVKATSAAFTLEPNTKYVFSAWYQCRENSGSFNVDFNVNGSNGVLNTAKYTVSAWGKITPAFVFTTDSTGIVSLDIDSAAAFGLDSVVFKKVAPEDFGVRNGDFSDKDISMWTKPASISLERTAASDHTKALVSTNPSWTTYSYNNIILEPNKEYRLSIWVYNYSVNASSANTLKVTSANGDTLGSLDCTVSGAWSSKVFVGKFTTDNTGIVNLALTRAGGAAFAFDDVSIVERVIGDVNFDGDVTASDLVELTNLLLDKPSSVYTFDANVNGDDNIDILDIVALKKILANLVAK